MRLRYTVIALLWPVLTVLAQTPVIKLLNIGDTVPDIKFENIINHPSTSVSLSDFKGKLVILDFWATWCTSCLQAFPKMDSLQNEFKDCLQVLLINSEETGDDSVKVDGFFKKWNRKYGKGLSLPSVINDTIAIKLFEHSLVPHYVWIAGDGKVIAVTSAGQVNADNIRAVTEGGSASFMMKKDQDAEKPLFSSNDLPENGLLNYSVFVKGWFDGLPSGDRLRQTGDITHGIAMTNSTLLNMYEVVVRKIKSEITKRRIVLDMKDSSEFLPPESVEEQSSWEKDNLYSFDLIVPVGQENRLYYHALEELNKYSGYYGRFEKRVVKCWVLTRTNKIDLLKAKGGEMENKLWEEGRPSLKNGTVGMLVERLNTLSATRLLVMDETEYKGKVDIEFSKGLDDLKRIQEELGRYGLRLMEGERRVGVFVLQKKQDLF